MTQSLMLALSVCGRLSRPIIVERLLNFLETDGKDAVIRPWAWILLLFFAPTFGNMAWQWYTYLAVSKVVSDKYTHDNC